jgi:hypothetical protein
VATLVIFVTFVAEIFVPSWLVFVANPRDLRGPSWLRSSCRRGWSSWLTVVIFVALVGNQSADITANACHSDCIWSLLEATSRLAACRGNGRSLEQRHAGGVLDCPAG